MLFLNSIENQLICTYLYRLDWDGYNNKTKKEQKEELFDAMYELLSSKNHLACFKWGKYGYNRKHDLPPDSINLICSWFD